MEPTMYGSTLGLEYESTRKTPLESFAPFFAEFLGTWLIVFTAGVISILGDAMWNATALAAIVTVCGYVFGPVSGGHFNPAVSLSAAFVGKEDWPRMIVYTVLQMVGGLLAGLTYSSAFGEATIVGPAPEYLNTSFPVIVEFLYTTVLCFVALNVVYARKSNPSDDQNHYFALAVGFVYIAGGYAAGNISGACFNPAIAFGMDAQSYFGRHIATSSSSSASWAWAYTGAESVAAFLAAILFRLCRPEERGYEVSGNFEPNLCVKMLSEFLGTSVLALTVGLCLVTKSAVTPWSAAAAYMSMIYALGSVSGAHFNPAVSLAVMFSGRGMCPPFRFLSFVAVQGLAAVLTGCVVASAHKAGPYSSDDSFCLKPFTAAGSSETYWWPVFVVEFLFTFMLAFAVLAVATVTPVQSYTRQNFPFGLAIGATVTAGGFAAGTISGGVLNPAVALGISMSCQLAGSKDAAPVSYFLNFAWFEICGGFVASLIFYITHRNEYKKREETA
eukprot:TRINITY_DN2907_c0_g1_i3.p1 TRINITY_DN2907_c0_g1~~TRINITY_DN2907_c0_g1_i3.p1  ORF type:complete len:544 (-),score=71.05 TRINITY_DN2907_c0_g1_i3:106-1608(-)